MTPSNMSQEERDIYMILKNHKNIINKNIINNNIINNNIFNNNNIEKNDKNNISNILKTVIEEFEKKNNKYVINFKNKINKLKYEIKELQKQLQEHQTLISFENQCNICMSQPKNHANINCGHMSACKSCSEKLNNICPICRTDGNFICIISS